VSLTPTNPANVILSNRTSTVVAGLQTQGVPAELLFRVTTGHVTLFVLDARLMRPYVHSLNVADFKGIRAG